MRKFVLLILGLCIIAATVEFANYATATGTPPTLSTIREVGSFEALGVSGNNTYAVFCSGAGCLRNILYKSSDEGVTWNQCSSVTPFSNEVSTFSVLSSGTFIVTTDGGSKLWRSTDGCATWQTVRLAVPNTSPVQYSQSLPQTPYKYQCLINECITDDGTFDYLGTYNQATTNSGNINYIYRSQDDGQTWDIVNTSATFKHIHSVHSYLNGPLVVDIGDLSSAGIWVSNDRGVTLTPVCTNHATDAYCIQIDSEFSTDHAFTYGSTDVPNGTNNLIKLNLSTGATTPLVQGGVPYESGSMVRTNDGYFLSGAWFEPETTVRFNDPNLRVYAIVNDTVTSVLSRPIPANALANHLWARLDVVGVLSNGDAVIYRSSYGTIFAKWDSGQGSTPPPTTSTTTTTTTTNCG